MKYLPAILRQWLPLATLIVGLCGLAFLIGQQVGRMNAEDPQIQLAEDAARALAQGAAPDAVLPPAKMNLEESLAPFVAVFNDSGGMLATSGLLHGKPPQPPAGVLDFSRQHGEDRVTWQPENGVRMATVTVHFDGVHPGFVLAGRSLRMVEERADNLLKIAALACAVLLAASLVIIVCCEWVLAKKQNF
jgi:hypothetical protein